MKRKTLTITSSQTRKRFSWCLNHVHFTFDRIEIYRRGASFAALVTVDDLHRLEAADQKSAKQKEYEMLAHMEAYRQMEGNWGGE